MLQLFIKFAKIKIKNTDHDFDRQKLHQVSDTILTYVLHLY